MTNKILVVDDDQENRALLLEVFGASGYAVHAVADGMTAREALRSDEEYRVVIADVRMPEESGLEFLRKLREQKSSHQVILMSSFLSVEERKAAKALGAYALLEKPLRLNELLQVVGQLAAPDRPGVLA